MSLSNWQEEQVEELFLNLQIGKQQFDRILEALEGTMYPNRQCQTSTVTFSPINAYVVTGWGQLCCSRKCRPSNSPTKPLEWNSKSIEIWCDMLCDTNIRVPVELIRDGGCVAYARGGGTLPWYAWLNLWYQFKALWSALLQPSETTWGMAWLDWFIPCRRHHPWDLEQNWMQFTCFKMDEHPKFYVD